MTKLGETGDSFSDGYDFAVPLHKRNKRLKAVKFQIPGTKTHAKKNNLERHVKAFPADEVAISAIKRL